jgi:predicted Zn finger-like uncharacterized protein
MYITCPSCSTSYEVDGTKIGREGRTVRCFNCSHTWHQYPVAAQPPPPRPVPSREANRGPYGPPAYGQHAYGREPAYAGAPAGYYAPPPYAPAPQAYAVPPTPNPFAAPEPVAYAPLPPQQMAPPPPPPPPEPKVEANPVDAIAAVMAANRAKPAPVVEEEAPSDEELDKMLGKERDSSSAFRGSVTVADDDDAIDEAAIEKIPDPKPLKQVVDEDEDDEFDDDDIDPDEIPDPEPIPGVYQGGDDEDEDDEEGGGGLKRLVLPAVIIVLLGVIASGLVLGRGMIVSMVPIANDYFYDLIGLHVMVPGDGLKRTLTRTAVETVANVDYVIATGTITNVSEKDQPVPTVFVQLVDAKGQVLDTKEVKPEKDMLKPGEVLNFKATFEGAPATARNVRTEWGKFEESAS